VKIYQKIFPFILFIIFLVLDFVIRFESLLKYSNQQKFYYTLSVITSFFLYYVLLFFLSKIKNKWKFIYIFLITLYFTSIYIFSFSFKFENTYYPNYTIINYLISEPQSAISLLLDSLTPIYIVIFCFIFILIFIYLYKMDFSTKFYFNKIFYFIVTSYLILSLLLTNKIWIVDQCLIVDTNFNTNLLKVVQNKITEKSEYNGLDYRIPMHLHLK